MKTSKLATMAIAGLAAGAFMATGVQAGDLSPENTAYFSGTKDSGIAHKCAGLNNCKGLGGCKVTEAKLKKLAKKAGVPDSKRGEAHKCAGLNECKGLGGCKVTKKKLADLKKKQAEKNSKK